MITLQNMKTPGKIFAIAFCTIIAAPAYSASITDTYASGDTLTAVKMDNIKTAVNDNDTNTATNTAGIATNVTGIATNATAAAANATAIAAKADASAAMTNAADIATNVTAIGNNTAAISGKADASAVTINATGIATNVTAIATNTTAIAGKAASSAVTTNTADIATNVTAITANATAIAGKAASSAVTTNTADIATNVTAITANATTIAGKADSSTVTTNTTGIATNVTAITALQAAPTCPTDMVKSGTICVDKFEASVWDAATAGNQISGAASAIYNTCSDTGSAGSNTNAVAIDCTNAIYARSVPSVEPAYDITQYQAAIACANVSKRLPTVSEWLVAAAGTTTGNGIATADCNNPASGGSLRTTGSPANCVSAAGAFDMIGNVYELTSDIHFGGVANGTNGTTTAAKVVALGGDYQNLLNSTDTTLDALVLPPTDILNTTLGFRCVKDL